MNTGDLLEFQDPKFHKLVQMSKDEISEFANCLYNYDKIDNETYGLSYSEITYIDYPRIFKYAFQEKSEDSPFEGELGYVIIKKSDIPYGIEANHPNIILHFNFQDSVEYLALFFDDTKNIRIMTTFHKEDTPYLGSECSCLNDRLRSFFQEKYNYIIKRCTFCNEDISKLCLWLFFHFQSTIKDCL